MCLSPHFLEVPEIEEINTFGLNDLQSRLHNQTLHIFFICYIMCLADMVHFIIYGQIVFVKGFKLKNSF